MDISKMLVELQQEREALSLAILTLERLAEGRGKRRGRPPAWLSEIKKAEKPLSSSASQAASAVRSAIAV
jgi:hypothetical protein